MKTDKFRKWLKIESAKKGFTIKEVAESMGMSPQNFNNKLAGKHGDADSFQDEVKNVIRQL